MLFNENNLLKYNDRTIACVGMVAGKVQFTETSVVKLFQFCESRNWNRHDDGSHPDDGASKKRSFFCSKLKNKITIKACPVKLSVLGIILIV